jgi:hypothetical protein
MFELGGQVIDGLWINEDQSIILFQHGNLELAQKNPQWYKVKFTGYKTDGDCCSETWFADIIGVKNLIRDRREEVIGIEKLDLPAPEDNRNRQDVDQAYGYRLKTKKGDCDIIFRNSSNGYYGGDIYLDTKTKEWDLSKFIRITDDWSA